MAQSLASREFLGMKNPMAHYIPLWVLVVFSFLSLIIIVYAGQHDFGKVEVNDLDVNGTLDLSQSSLSLGGDLSVSGTTTATGRLSLGSQLPSFDLQTVVDNYLPAGANGGTAHAVTQGLARAITAVGALSGTITNTNATSTTTTTGDIFNREAWGRTTGDYLAILDATGNVANTVFTGAGLTAGLNFFKLFGDTGAGTRTVTLPAATAGQTIVIVLTGVVQANTEVLQIISPNALDNNSIAVDCTVGGLPIGQKAGGGNDRLQATAGGATSLEGYVIAVPTGTTYQIIFLEGDVNNSAVIFA